MRFLAVTGETALPLVSADNWRMKHSLEFDLRVGNVYYLKRRPALADRERFEVPEEVRMALETLEAMLKGAPEPDGANRR